MKDADAERKETNASLYLSTFVSLSFHLTYLLTLHLHLSLSLFLFSSHLLSAAAREP